MEGNWWDFGGGVGFEPGIESGTISGIEQPRAFVIPSSRTRLTLPLAYDYGVVVGEDYVQDDREALRDHLKKSSGGRRR